MVAVTLASPLTVWAIDPDRTMSQYEYQTWGKDQGFPRGPVYSIDQTKDGYLWVGSERGMIRFDGLSFQLTDSAAPEQPSLTHVLGLLAAPDGALWLRLRRPGLTLLRYDNGTFRNPMGDLATRASVSVMARAWNGDPLFCFLEGGANAVVIRDRKFEKVFSPGGLSESSVLAITQTLNGDIWIGTSDQGLLRIHQGRITAVNDGLPDLKVNVLTPAANNQMWVGTDNGVARWDGNTLTSVGVPSSLRGIQALALLVDGDANLWVGTNSQGLARINAGGVSWMRRWPNEEEHPANEAVTALFEDREGNLWAGTDGALERIRDSAFVTYSQADGMPSDNNGPLYADANGRLWFAPAQGGLWWSRAGKREQLNEAGLTNDVVYSIAGGDNRLWVGRQHGGLTLLRSNPAGQDQFAATTYTTVQGLAENSVYSVYESRDGSVWAGTLSKGVSRLRQGEFTTYMSKDGLASNTVAAITEDQDGTMWFGTPNGLSALSHNAWRTFGPTDGLPSENINCLLVDSGSGLWIGTANGLSFRNSGGIRTIARAPASLREPILGIAEDSKGSLWISTSAHVVRVNRDKLIGGNLADGDIREFTIADGLRRVEGVRRSRSVVSDQSGRIWFSMTLGLSVVDPARLTRHSAPALAHVQGLSVNGMALNLKNSIHVSGDRMRLTVQYAGLSLASPAGVRYRYRLEGFEDEWSNPVAAREAVYTNLSPGAYRFRVIASNANGAWSNEESALSFVVDPMYWQTWWFRLSVVFTCGLAALLFYRLRLRQITLRQNLRFEERLAERTRIAQELQDTLVQGFLSASIQVHVTVGGLPDDARAKPILTRALEQMGQVIDEGGNALRGLRAPGSGSSDLEHAFSLVPQELGALAPEGVRFCVIVDGEQRRLRPLLRDEVYRICREALVNAFRHSHAKHIEIELRYSSSQLRIFVRDDGSGIDPEIIETGREGHWGLSGMRERADRIGGRLHVFSRTPGGTEIELAIPGHLAFEQQSGQRGKWFAHGR